MVLPEGSAVPPLPHLLVLAASAVVVGWLLWRERPAITSAVVVGLAPWMLLGAALHVLHQLGAVPTSIAPFFGTLAVYVATVIVAGAVWLLVLRLDAPVPRWLGAVGGVAFLIATGAVLAAGGVGRVVLPLVALLVAVLLGGATWIALDRRRPAAAAVTGYAGLLVVLGHAIDGVSTAVGVDLLGFGERTPGSRAVMEIAAALPTADVIGVGWFFVLVKLVIAAVVVVLFADFVREEPSAGNALLGLIAAVGLGPGVHNLLLYVVAVA